jgi:hypothetical protein
MIDAGCESVTEREIRMDGMSFPATGSMNQEPNWEKNGTADFLRCEVTTFKLKSLVA